MNNSDLPKRIDIGDWTFRVKVPAHMDEHTRILLLLHGHLGNENVMWILTKTLPENLALLAPRAPIKMGVNQYSWHKIGPHWPKLDVYQAVLSQLLIQVNEWREPYHLQDHQVDVMGFSQGAVMAYAFSMLYPDQVGRVAALAGFIPNQWKETFQNAAFNGKTFYVAHGIHDEVIPIEQARKTVNWLRKQSAQVTFCEADIGHKLSAKCYKDLGNFFRKY